MPAQLRNGKAVNQRSRGPDLLNICTACDECLEETTFDANGAPMPGRRFYSDREYQKHRKFLREAETLSNHVDLSPPALNIPALSNAALPFRLPSTPRPLTVADATAPSMIESDPNVSLDASNGVPYDWRKVLDLQSQLTRRKDADFLDPTSFHFVDAPSSANQALPKQGTPTLQEGHPGNSHVLGHLQWLQESLSFITNHCTKISGCRSNAHFRLLCRTVASAMQKDIDAANEKIRQEWMRRKDILAIGQEHVSAPSTSFLQCTGLEQVVLLYCLVACILHLLCNVSLDHMGFVLYCFRFLSELQLMPKDVAKNIPMDMRTLLSRFDLPPNATEYVSCPKCFKLYPLDSFPEFCDGTASAAPAGDQCNRRLQTKEPPIGRNVKVPVQTYQHNNIRHWIASLYNRSDIAPHLRRRFSSAKNKDTAHDIWDGSVLETLRAPGEKKPFFASGNHPNEDRLLFSLNVDGFNPYGNRIAGKMASICGLYMVCLNLPPSLRFKVENMFLVGVIPGPKEPSFHKINYILAPLIDDLLVLWERGIYVSKTCIRPAGQAVKGALVPVVCDLPGARLITGFAHHSNEENSCASCHIEDRNNIDISSWVPRSASHHRKVANQWKAAETVEERDAIFKREGVRWSELLRLPYWDPVRFTVIDSMHCFYLRLLKGHCRETWRMDVTLADGDGAWEYEEPSDEDKDESFTTFRHESASALKKLPVKSLRYLALRVGLNCHGKKKAILAALLDFRVENGWFNANQQPMHSAPSENHNHYIADPAQRKDSLASAREEYRFGCYKKDLKVYTIAVIRALASGEKIVGAEHMKKQEIIDRLFELREASRKKGAEIETLEEKSKREKEACMKLLKTGSKTSIDKANMDVLRGLISCIKSLHATGKNRIGGLDSVEDSEGVIVGNRKVLRNFIHTQRKVLKITDEDNKVIQASGLKTAVLGKGRLAEIRADMSRLQLPSWMPRAPRHPGEAKHGKLTADQWRSFTTINLPITLIRLWACKPKESREHKLLVNFMHLITAVRLANMRFQSEDRIVKFESHMMEYIRGLRDLFPERNVTPYQHMSLHFGSMLRNFGPVHSWRCFAFERYNYVLQNIPNNCRLGDLEKTIFIRFCELQKLRSLLHQDNLPAALRPISSHFEMTFGSQDVRGTRLGDALAFEEQYSNTALIDWSTVKSTPLDRKMELKIQASLEPGSILSSSDVVDHDRIRRLDVTFTTASATFSDAQVVFRSEEDCGWSAGSIVRLLTCRVENLEGAGADRSFAIIRNYNTLSSSDSKHDPYRQFGFFGGRLFYDDLSETTMAIPVDLITAHFAHTTVTMPKITKGVIHVLPQNKEYEFPA